jgi:hypothetical protein
MTDNNKMTFVSHTNPIDLSTWHWFDEDNTFVNCLAKGFALRVTEVLREAFKETPPSATLPFMWAKVDDDDEEGDGVGGPQVADPLTIYVDLPLAHASDVSCVFSITLEDMIDDLISFLCTYSTVTIDDRTIPDKVAARLRELAQKLDDTKPKIDSSSSSSLSVNTPAGEDDGGEQGTGGPALVRCTERR